MNILIDMIDISFSTVATIVITSVFLGVIAFLVQRIGSDLVERREQQLKALHEENNVISNTIKTKQQ